MSLDSRLLRSGLLALARVTLVGLGLVPGVDAHSSFPPTDHVGIDWPIKPPPRQTCSSVCHIGGPGSGSLALSGLPPAWEPGRTYSLLVELVDPAALRFGFELTVLDTAFTPAGKMIRTDAPATALSTDVDRAIAFLLHTGAGNDCNLCPVQNGHRWMLDWEAPLAPGPADGMAVFYLCGNGADGDDSLRGDHIYCLTLSVPEIACPPALGAITGLSAARRGPDIDWRWQPEPLAVEGYRLYGVATKEELPAARGSTGAALRDCVAPAAADSSCTEPMAGSGPGSWFYQLVAVCAGGLEGPN